MANNTKIKITLVRSLIGSTEKQIRVAKALGLMNPNEKVLVTIDTETGEIIT